MTRLERARRFVQPEPGAPAAVRFPAVHRETLPNGLRVWTIPHTALPVVTMALVVPFGSRHDPVDRPGLAGVMADLLDEGAGGRDAIALAQAFAALGAEPSVDVGSDVTTVSVTVLSRFFEPAVALLVDVVARPRLEEPDFARVREIRRNRLRQLRSSASAIADRVLLRGVFGEHPYGHGTLGSFAALDAMTVEEVRDFHAAVVRPDEATWVVAGDVTPDAARQILERHAGAWRSEAPRVPVADPVRPSLTPPRVLLVDRPGTPQTEVRVGHPGPSRHVDGYHTLVTLNALLGGQFSSRINLNLRETRGLTYGAHTSFDFRQLGGAFSCDTNVQGDATPLVVTEILEEFRAIGTSRPAEGEELARAKSSLTRGFVRLFETPAHLAHAAVRLATFGLPGDTFDRFVPAVEAVEAADVSEAARVHVRPDDATIVLVGDSTSWRGALDAFQRPIEEVSEP